MKKAFIIFLSSFLIPAAALAQNFQYTDRVVNQFEFYLTRAVSIIMIIMTVWFLYVVFLFIKEKDPTKMKDRKKQLINGLIGLFVAVAVWGIISIASRIVGVNSANSGPVNITCPPGLRPDNGVCVR